ncbi:DUF5753 domain-containing protein [Actinoalloteichus sp. AHMU CJ021]|uniref:DUF5753 domain-containing protein n=1 Tax=Actinoalloteichus sp. AHMU CJ021 TaxID=2072503 RepID=UPI0026B50B39
MIQLDLAGGGRPPFHVWLERGHDRPKQLDTLVEFEREAARQSGRITDVSMMLVPGLLQIPAYTREIMRLGGVAPTEVEKWVRVRQARQLVLGQLDFIAVLDEGVLARPVGGSDVMANQLRAILEVAGRERTTVRVLPKGNPSIALNGSWVLMSTGPRPVVHLEHLRSGLFVFAEADVSAYEIATATVMSASLGPAESSNLIRDYLTTFAAAAKE